MRPEAYRSLLETEQEHWWFRARGQIVMDVLAACLKARSTGSGPRCVLDVGAGGGGLSEVMTRFGRVVAVERAPNALARLRHRAGVTAVEASLPRLPFLSGSFDVVTAFDVLEHVEDDGAAMDEIARVLRAGGSFLATVPAHPCLWGGHDAVHGHFRRYRPGEFEDRVEAAGLRVEFATPFHTLLMPFLAAQRWIWRLASRPAPVPSTPPAPVNAVLRAIFASERYWLRAGRRLPVGSSHLVFARAEVPG